MRGVRTKFKVGDEVYYNHWDEISLFYIRAVVITETETGISIMYSGNVGSKSGWGHWKGNIKESKLLSKSEGKKILKKQGIKALRHRIYCMRVAIKDQKRITKQQTKILEEMDKK